MNRLLLFVLCLITLVLAPGCGGKPAAVTPAEMDQTPTSPAPVGAEPVLPDEGP